MLAQTDLHTPPLTLAGSTQTTAYPVMEHFYTLQGEGVNAGKAAYFVRLAGCDVGCVWCDVKESWDATGYPIHTANDILQWVTATPATNVVITGGEPALHNLAHLTDAFHAAGLQTWIETSGTQPISGTWNWVCLSPKKFKAPLPEALAVADEFKVVVFHKSDLQWMEQFLPLLKPDVALLLQPEWSRAEQMQPLLVEYIKANPQWRLSLQTHKYLAIP